MADVATWRAKLEHNALWVSLGLILLGVGVVAVGVQVAPEVFWDRFVWEDIYGPLVVDAYQCRTIATCPGLEDPAGISVKDGYTITSELTYGLVLAVMLYGIYVGLFRRFGIVADGWFVLGLTPWILLGPLARALEDANVFCQAGTSCTPGPFAYVFISPVIYIHIALYVIAFMLLGVYLERRRQADPRLLTGAVAAVLGLGVAAYAFIGNQYGHWFSALPPLWFVLGTALLGTWIFHVRARRGLASMNLTVFVLGLPYALGCIYLILQWISGDVWSLDAWNGALHLEAGSFILATAAAAAAIVYALGRKLGRSEAPGRLGAIVARAPKGLESRLGWGGLAALGAAFALSGALEPIAAALAGVPFQEVLIPLLGWGGVAALVAFALLHVGRDLSKRPHLLIIYAAGINVALVFGHMMDGLATWVALEDPLGFGVPQYSEKHPVSEILLRYWDGFLFPFTKLVMVLVVAWLLDREFHLGHEGEGATGLRQFDERNMVGLVKMAIFVLGFAPGLRDVLRLTMGV